MDYIQNGRILKMDNKCKGLQSALVVLGTNNHIYLLTVTPTGKFYITDEGVLNSKFDEKGEIIQK